MRRLPSWIVVEFAGRDFILDMHELRCGDLRCGCVDFLYELRGGILPAGLGVGLVFILPRGLILCGCGPFGGDGVVLGGPVLGLHRDGLQRLRERLLPELKKPELLRGLSEWSLQRFGSAQHGLPELRGRLLSAGYGRSELRQLPRRELLCKCRTVCGVERLLLGAILLGIGDDLRVLQRGQLPIGRRPAGVHRVSRRSVLVVWCVELFELQRGILCGLVGKLVVVDLCELCCWVLLGGWCEHVFWLRWRLLPRSLGRSCVRHVFRWVLRGDSLRGVLRLRCGDFRVVLRGVRLPLVRCGLVHVVDGSERVRVVLRRDLPAEHRLDELCELPLGDLPEHDRRDFLNALRGLRGGPVRCVGGVGGMRLLRRWVVLGCWRRGVLELRRGHLPVCVGVGVVSELRRGVVLHLGGVVSDDSVPPGKLLLRRRVGDWSLRRGHVLRRRGECLL